MKEMEEIKQFTKSTERKLEEPEMALLKISRKKHVNYIENSMLLLELLKNHIYSLEKVLMGKDSIMGFLLKQKSEPDISSVNDTAEKTITNLLKQ